MVGFKDKLLFSHNKKELTKDLPYFDKVKVRYMYYYWTAHVLAFRSDSTVALSQRKSWFLNDFPVLFFNKLFHYFAQIIIYPVQGKEKELRLFCTRWIQEKNYFCNNLFSLQHNTKWHDHNSDYTISSIWPPRAECLEKIPIFTIWNHNYTVIQSNLYGGLFHS